METELETTVDLLEMNYFQKEARRSVVNRELMMLYGYDVTGYLPPLPSPERPKSSACGSSWDCDNQAMRQVSNTHRSSSSLELKKRPHTAYTTHVRDVLNTRLPDRPHTSVGTRDRNLPKKVIPCENPLLIVPRTSGVITQLKGKPVVRRPLKKAALKISLATAMTKTEKLEIERDDATISDGASVVSSSVMLVGGGLRKPRVGTGRAGSRGRPRKDRRKALFANLEQTLNEDIQRVMNGDTDRPPQHLPSVVRVGVVSQPHDMLVEKRAIQEHVYPKLRLHCRRLGLELEIVDCHVQPDLVAPPDVKYNLQQIRRCHDESLGPSVIALVGDYYGDMTVPQCIAARDFDGMCKAASVSRLGSCTGLQRHYRLDENSVPHTYVLQDADSMTAEEMVELRRVLRESVTVAIQIGKIPQRREMEFIASDLDLEIHKGVIKTKSDIAATRVLCFQRKFDGLKDDLNNPHAGHYTDLRINDGFIMADPQKQDLLDILMERVQHHVGEANFRRYDVAWPEEGGVHPDTYPQHEEYILQFTNDVLEGLKRLVELNRMYAQVKNPLYPIYKEVLQHHKITNWHTDVFAERGDILNEVKTCLTTPGQDTHITVLCGPPGAGKSALLGGIMHTFSKWMNNAKCVSVIRHIGVTASSSDLKEILINLCFQVTVIYNMDPPSQMDRRSAITMSRYFNTLLERVSKHHASKRPLMILFGDLDRLTEKDRANTLSWLPRNCPSNVFIIVSVNTTSIDFLDRLNKKTSSANFITVGPLSQDDIEGVVDKVLKNSSRQLTEQQKAAICVACHEECSPLLARTLATMALSWQSEDTINAETLPNSTEKACLIIIQKQEFIGPVFVKTALGYMCLLNQGLSSMELLDLLLCHKDVLQELTDSLEPGETVEQTMAHKLNLLLERVGPYLKVTDMLGLPLYSWGHAAYRDTVCRRCVGTSMDGFGDTPEAHQFHQLLLWLFTQGTQTPIQADEDQLPTLARNDEDKPLHEPTPQLLVPGNTRKLQLLPQLVCLSSAPDEAQESLKENLFCQFTWIMTKLQGLSVKEILKDMTLCKGHDLEVDIVRDVLLLTSYGLGLDPQSLPLQLIGCLPYLCENRYPLIDSLIEASISWIKEQSMTMIVPMFQCFPSAIDHCKERYWGLVDILAVEKNGQMGVVKNKDGVIEIWDIVSNESIFNLGISYDKVSPNVFASETHVLGVTTPPTNINIWEIESGIIEHDVNLEKIFPEGNSVSCLCCTVDFETVAFLSSDEDFNTDIIILNTNSKKVITKLTNYDLKDEFFNKAAVLISDASTLLFVNTRSEIVDEETLTSSDFVFLNSFTVDSGANQFRINCGDKPFHGLIVHEEKLAVVSWKDCSFDTYSLRTGRHVKNLRPPRPCLQIQECQLSGDAYLVALGASTSEASAAYYGMWVWNLEEESTSELFAQELSQDDEAPGHFVVAEDLALVYVACPNSARLTVWDLPNSECVGSFKAHTDGCDHLLLARDPYRLFTGSGSEKVLKLWDFYELVSNYRDAGSSSYTRLTRPRRTPGRQAVTSKQVTPPEGILKRPESIMRSNTGSGRPKSVRFADEHHAFTDSDARTDSRPDSSTSWITESDPSPEVDEGEFDLDNREAATMQMQAAAMDCVTVSVFTQDSEHVVCACSRGAPVVWAAGKAMPSRRLEQHAPDDLATPWLCLACDDRYVVGLTTRDDLCLLDDQTCIYRLQIWELSSGQPAVPEAPEVVEQEEGGEGLSELPVSHCVLLSERTRALVSVIKVLQRKIVLGDIDQATYIDVSLRLIDVRQQSVLQHIEMVPPVVPVDLQLTDDDLYVVLLCGGGPEAGGDPARTLYTLSLEGDNGRPRPDLRAYQYRRGRKMKRYAASANCLLRKGTALAAGLNGDLQLWDVTSGEYEGNLFEDPNVKERNDPGLHNHGGQAVNHLLVSEDGHYVVCGGGDGVTSVWDLDDEVILHTYAGHRDQVKRVCIAADNQLVLTSGADFLLCVWQFGVTERPLARLYIHLVATTLTLSPDKKRIAVTGSRKNENSRFMLFQLRNLREISYHP